MKKALRIALFAFMSAAVFPVDAERWDVRDYVTLPDPTTQSGNTCWAHASAHAVMANWAYLSSLADGSYDEYAPDSVLSAEHMVAHRAYNNAVENGGSVDYAIAYYASGQGPRVVNAQDDTVDAKYFVGSVNKLPYSNAASALSVSIALVKAALKSYGAVSVVLNTAELQSPYYDAVNHSAYMSVDKAASLSLAPNHAGVIVGYDDDFNDFGNLAEKPSSPGAWIVEDSYGTSRHVSGYYYLSYNSGTLNAPYAYVNRIDRSVVDTIMTKDRLGASGVLSFDNDSVVIFSFFGNPKGVTVKALGVYTAQSGVKMELGLYKGGSMTTVSKKSSARVDTVFANLGYHVVRIPDAYIPAGDSIALGALYVNPTGGKIALPLESSNSSGTAVVTHVGDQYMIYNKKGYKRINATSNFIMKLYCKNDENVSAVVENEAGGAGLQAWSVADGIMVRTDEKAAVSVYDANGRLVAVADVDGEALVKVPARGVYVVASGGSSVKVIK